MSNKEKFAGGKNIAMKVPPHLYEATIRFYGEVLGLKEITKHSPEVGFEFGSNNLWIDCVPGISQAEIWLEVVTNDPDNASALLASAGLARCDEIEPLPEGFPGFWISSPASIVHLVCKEGASWE